MEELTKTEERIMQVLWDLGNSVVRDIIDKLPDEPKPPYSTISSVVRILEKKGYVGFKAYGKTYEYFPLITKTEYRKHSFSKLFNDYFNGSADNLLSFMVKEENLTPDEINNLKTFINNQ